MCVAHKEFKPKRALQQRNSLAPRDFIVRSLAVVEAVHITASSARRVRRQLPQPWPGGHGQWLLIQRYRNVPKMNWMPLLAALALQPLPMPQIYLTYRR